MPTAEPLRRFLSLLDLTEVGPDIFRGRTPEDRMGGRLFGGHVAAQALRAAVHTIASGQPVHSLHAYFLRPGHAHVPIDLRVERVREGRSFATRRVLAVQEGETIFDMTASFHRVEESPGYQVSLDPGVPPPEHAEPAEHRGGVHALLPLERRELGPVRAEDGTYLSTRRSWMRLSEPLPDDPILHVCILTFLSDMGMVGASRATVEDEAERFMSASLDHSMWFHRPIRVDDWFLYDRRAISVSGARGLAYALIHDHRGRLGATVAQESLLRPMRSG